MSTFSLLTRPPIAAGLLLGAAPFAPVPVRACGPDFPNSYLSAPFSEQSQLPTLGFRGELDRLRTAQEITFGNRLAAASDPAQEQAAELAELRTIDRSIASCDRLRPPPGLPLEFQLYAQGVKAWQEQNLAEAELAWKRLLDLPAEQRHFRSTWAAFMLGRAEEAADAAEARRYWRLTRQLAQTGFADSQHLAAGSWGAEARWELQHNHAAEAVKLYWAQYRAGGLNAATSLQFALRTIFLDKPAPHTKTLRQLANDAETRAVVTAWFVARGGPYQSWHHEEAERFGWWLTALSRPGQLPAAEADRWAWAAYAAGEWAVAQTLADQAPPDAPASEWVRGLLFLRKGKLDDAAHHLANAARAFPLDESSAPTEDSPAEDPPHACLDGLRGALALRQDQYFQALRIFLAAQHWIDAAYVAEKVLSVDELKSYVDVESPLDPSAVRDQRSSDTAKNLRCLLARRLMRANRFAEARRYFSDTTRSILDTYVDASQRAYDEAQPKSVRADAFRHAAEIMEEHGMELIGTELEPDFAVWDGSFEWPGLMAARDLGSQNLTRREAIPAESAQPDPLAPTWTEEFRISKSATPTHRFHYRYKAIELAWLAASLSPDDDPRTAEILTEAGNWVAARDPETANLFYKALALRCPHTTLGQKALATHWLPEI